VLASTAIPVVFPPVWRETERDVLVDGGVRQITPLSAAFGAQPDEIYVLMTSRAERTGAALPNSTAMRGRYEDWSDNFLGTRVDGLDVLKRAVDLLTDEVYLNDVSGALEWNDVLRDAGRLLNAAVEAGGPTPLVEAAKKLRETLDATKKRHVPIHVLAPREWYGETNASTAFDPSLIAKAIDHGRAVARDPSLWLWP
jgi:NTE family protein